MLGGSAPSDFVVVEIGQPLPMKPAQLSDLGLEGLRMVAATKCLVATLKRGRRCQKLSARLLVRFGELGHAVVQRVSQPRRVLANRHIVHLRAGEVL